MDTKVYDEMIADSLIPMNPHPMNKYKKRLSVKNCKLLLNDDLEKQKVPLNESIEDLENEINSLLESDKNISVVNKSYNEDVDIGETINDEEEKKESIPKQTDKAESDKNGIVRKQLYVAFIEYAKELNSKNVFASVFDKDIFHVTYPFVPDEMRYFYRISNPLLCVLEDTLTFFELSELKNINKNQNTLNNLFIIFAADKFGNVILFKYDDKKVYNGKIDGVNVTVKNEEAPTFDEYIQKLVGKDILGTGLIPRTKLSHDENIENNETENNEENNDTDENIINDDQKNQQENQPLNNNQTNQYSTSQGSTATSTATSTVTQPVQVSTNTQTNESVSLFEKYLFGNIK